MVRCEAEAYWIQALVCFYVVRMMYVPCPRLRPSPRDRQARKPIHSSSSPCLAPQETWIFPSSAESARATTSSQARLLAWRSKRSRGPHSLPLAPLLPEFGFLMIPEAERWRETHFRGHLRGVGAILAPKSEWSERFRCGLKPAEGPKRLSTPSSPAVRPFWSSSVKLCW